MEALVFLSYKNMWHWNIAFRARSLEMSDKQLVVMGPSETTQTNRDSISRWSKLNGITEVLWIDDLEPAEMVKRLQEEIVEKGAENAVIISESVEHQAAADLLGAEFMRALDWMR